MARNLTDPVDGCLRRARSLIHDRDPLYTRDFGGSDGRMLRYFAITALGSAFLQLQDGVLKSCVVHEDHAFAVTECCQAIV